MKTIKYTIANDEFYFYKLRMYAWDKTKDAIKHGKLVRPNTCEMCLCEEKVEAHHVDYGRPLDVKWLCGICHERAHYAKSPLNPDNNQQTIVELPKKKKRTATILVQIPMENYLVLKDQCDKEKRQVKSAIKSCVVRMNPAVTKIDYEGDHDYTLTQYVPGVSGVVAYDTELQEPKLSRIQEPRGEGHNGVFSMDRFYSLSSRDGRYAEHV
jgi:hypothetical protein